MASDAIDTAVTELTEENSEQTEQSGAEKKKEKEILLLQIKKRRHTKKVMKLQHELERVCLEDSELMVTKSVIEQLWTALENAQETLEELTAFYIEVGDESGKKEDIEESQTIKRKVQRALEAGQTVIKTLACKTINTSRPISVNMTDSYDQQPAQQYQLNESHGNHDDWLFLKTKYGDTRQLPRAYMDQLEQMPSIRSNDIHALEKFADLV